MDVVDTAASELPKAGTDEDPTLDDAVPLEPGMEPASVEEQEALEQHQLLQHEHQLQHEHEHQLQHGHQHQHEHQHHQVIVQLQEQHDLAQQVQELQDVQEHEMSIEAHAQAQVENASEEAALAIQVQHEHEHARQAHQHHEIEPQSIEIETHEAEVEVMNMNEVAGEVVEDTSGLQQQQQAVPEHHIEEQPQLEEQDGEQQHQHQLQVQVHEQGHQEEEMPLITLEQEVHLLKNSVRMMQESNEQLQVENDNLKNQVDLQQQQLQQSSSGQVINEHAHDDPTATAAAAAQLTNYQNALALSETQKSQLVSEVQSLRNRLSSLGYSVDVGSVVPSAIHPQEAGGVKEVGDATAAAAQIDITEAEALMAIDHNGHAAAVAAHGVVHPTHHPHAMHVHPHVPPQHPIPHPYPHHPGEVPPHHSPNTAGLSSRSEEKWEMHFSRLAQYKAQHDNCLVPTSTELGRWLCRQRHNFRYKSLKEDRKQRLMDLDKTCLGERVAELASTGLLAVDGTLKNEDGTPVNGDAAGAENTATMPKLNSKTKYNQAYESKLHAKWDKYFQELVSYKEEHGHSNFPTMNGSLGRWISRQRTLYRSKKLKSDRYEKLHNLGFAFEDATALEFKGKLDQQWEDMFNKLLKHKEVKGHCFDVPETWPLGKWLYRQRWLYRHGNLREDRAKKLLDVGFEDKKVLKRDSGGLGRKKTKEGR